MDTNQDTTCTDLHSLVTQRIKIPPRYNITHQGKVLPTDNTLIITHGITSLSTIHHIGRLRGGIPAHTPRKKSIIIASANVGGISGSDGLTRLNAALQHKREFDNKVEYDVLLLQETNLCEGAPTTNYIDGYNLYSDCKPSNIKSGSGTAIAIRTTPTTNYMTLTLT